MADIDRIQSSFYKYKGETDVVEKGNEIKYRPNMHLGVIPLGAIPRGCR